MENLASDNPADPFALFHQWYAEAQASEVNDPNAMALATCGPDGFPAVRIVLMKDVNERGLTFFTNRESIKGRHLQAHPKAAINFHWKSLRRQVRAEGVVELLSDSESDAYFATRHRQSQLGAWASQQSRPLADRATLEQRLLEFEQKYSNHPVPRPSYWGGYCLIPHRLEFWQERPHRLHDRIVFRREAVGQPWFTERLYP